MSTAVGCGSLEAEAEGGDSEGSDATPWVCEECDNSDESSPGDDGDGQGDANQPDQPILTTPCAPRPAPAADVEEVPEIPDEVRRARCPLEDETTGRQGADAPYRAIRWSRTDTGYRMVERGRNGDVERELRFEIRDGTVRRIERQRANLRYGNGHGETVWRFDEQGRLDSYRERRWADEETTDLIARRGIRQTWTDGRLVARTVRTGGIELGDRGEANFRWTYDSSGRMTEAHYRTDSGRTKRVEWTYADGRPASVERFVDGVPTFSQSWNYRSDGRLASRSVQYGRRGLDGRLDEDLPATPALDDLATEFPESPKNIYGVLRMRSKWRPLPQKDAQRGCYELPNSVGHGYPSSRRAYSLIWGDVDRKSNMFPLYGFDGLGIDYPGRGWYGHGGTVGGRPAGGETSDAVEVQIDYDSDGRMASERVRRETPDGRTTVLQRAREFTGQGLVEDRLVVESTPPGADADDRQVHRRTLDFERGREGRIQRRELRIDGQRMSYQDFEYDQAGRWTGLEAFERDAGFRAPRRVFANLIRPVDTSEPGDSRESATFRRKFDERGRPVLQSWSLDGRISVRSSRKRTVWGPHGPVEVVDDNPEHPEHPATRRTFQYDDRGRKVRLEVDRKDDGQPERVERWRWRDNGTLAAHVEEDRRHERVKTTRYRYACSAD